MPYSPDDTVMDDSFEDNGLLAVFPEALADKMRKDATFVTLEAGDVLFSAGDTIKYTYFPLAPTVISLIIELDDNRRVEAASIGQEGAIGGIVSCGDLPAFTRAEVQVGGRAMRLPLQTIEDAKQSSRFLRELYCRYADYLLAQVMQSVACNAFHPIEARAARWLLTARDRAGDSLALTQEALASLLGVQRTTVNAAAKQLQHEGLIEYRRGRVEIRDVDKLRERTCDCYGRVERHRAAVLGGTEAHWISDCAD
ncbi:Crp/Fnr family transcriptional regulator [Sphingomicrobium marinum]|uniref:Crp/Fnr family transcriptional regulator n=1 Tax=Sphingomicrobium marinum TaxID=1227950 RepID=UPI00224008D0|nr:Crp/Fnr family transcriptional regulator [Sphingomicrobium marinum]